MHTNYIIIKKEFKYDICKKDKYSYLNCLKNFGHKESESFVCDDLLIKYLKCLKYKKDPKIIDE